MTKDELQEYIEEGHDIEWKYKDKKFSIIPIPDPRGTNALFWKVDGSFNNSNGIYELVIDPPYKPGTMVKEIELTSNATFVRVYDKVNSRMQGG